MKSIDDILNSSVNDASDNNIKEALAYLTNNKNKYYEENKSKETHLTSVELLQLITSNNKDDKDDKELEKLLESIPHKFIRFYENVRPPYTGTYSKYFKLPKQNPFSTEGTGFNYDYDSDLEWINDDEDGEELGNVEDLDEDEDEEDEDCADEDDNMIFGEEFDDFLAKEEESDGNSDSKRKKKFLGPLIPIVKINAVFKLNNNSNCTVALNDKEDGQFFDSIKMKMFYDTPVDPLMIISKKSEGSRSSVNNNEYKRSLQESNIGTSSLTEIDGKNLPISSKKFKKNIVTDGKDLSAMFDEIQGNKFSLSTLTEITQDKFTNYSQETIKNTIKEYATRDPKSKLWHIKDKQHWNLLKEGNTQP
ncbi:Rlf2p SCDLUD_001570 [Saccharomycodes ludwigii]|uniref:Rlf2p n=1 Tax=Saccharomycodes ludwigii TaxID=36035 RepID=UPI001E8A8437|nr:hypothetical protein SCDLUD_001570 [Saccharomycodes ludwigii]KAH3901791.1 hypothetical protein SCDLUD_001570 [Saccharomycodes ludwigii]